MYSDAVREKAAQLIAGSQHSLKEIARQCRISLRCLDGWRADCPFQARIACHLEALQESIRTSGIADVHRRIQRKNDRWNRLHRIVEERARDPKMANVPGGESGLLVRKLRNVGGRAVAEFVTDTGLLAAMRAEENDVGSEVERVDKARGARKPAERSGDLSGLSNEELDRFEDASQTLIGLRKLAQNRKKEKALKEELESIHLVEKENAEQGSRKKAGVHPISGTHPGSEAPRVKPVTCRDVMRGDFGCCLASETVAGASRIMSGASIEFLVVIEPDGSIGIITDRALAKLYDSCDPNLTLMGSVTSRSHTCSPGDSYQQALGVMKEHKVKYISVVDESSKVIGVVSEAAKDSADPGTPGMELDNAA
jgi:CBS domain-containing protein